MQAEMRDHKMDEFWREEVWPLVPAVLGIQQRGLLVDRDAKVALRKQLRAELNEVDEAILRADKSGELAKPVGKSPHGLNAPKRVAKFLYHDLGLKVPKRTATGLESTDQESLIRCWQKLRKKDAHAKPVLENLFHRSKVQTVDERYLEFFIHPDGRVRPTIKMIGTETLRFAYSDPPLQQITNQVRKIFVPKPGHVFLVHDYSQLEARIQCTLAGVRRDQEILDSGEDLHKLTAQEIFEVERSQWEDTDPIQAKGMRNYAKSFRYRLAYGGDPGSVGKLGAKNFCPCPRCVGDVPPVVNLPPGTITKAGQRFLSNRPEIEKWRQLMLREVRDTKALRVMGRLRYFFGPVDAVKREVFNFPIQFIAAWIMNRATRAIHEMGGELVMQLHDALMLEVPEREAGLWSGRLAQVMEKPVEELGSVVFPTDAEIHKPWGVIIG
jgi:DNA polymerase-1